MCVCVCLYNILNMCLYNILIKKITDMHINISVVLVHLVSYYRLFKIVLEKGK